MKLKKNEEQKTQHQALKKKHKEIKGLKINSLLHTCVQQITLKHKREE